MKLIRVYGFVAVFAEELYGDSSTAGR